MVREVKEDTWTKSYNKHQRWSQMFILLLKQSFVLFYSTFQTFCSGYLSDRAQAQRQAITGTVNAYTVNTYTVTVTLSGFLLAIVHFVLVCW